MTKNTAILSALSALTSALSDAIKAFAAIKVANGDACLTGQCPAQERVAWIIEWAHDAAKKHAPASVPPAPKLPVQPATALPIPATLPVQPVQASNDKAAAKDAAARGIDHATAPVPSGTSAQDLKKLWKDCGFPMGKMPGSKDAVRCRAALQAALTVRPADAALCARLEAAGIVLPTVATVSAPVVTVEPSPVVAETVPAAKPAPEPVKAKPAPKVKPAAPTAKPAKPYAGKDAAARMAATLATMTPETIMAMLRAAGRLDAVLDVLEHETPAAAA